VHSRRESFFGNPEWPQRIDEIRRFGLIAVSAKISIYELAS
jgi:hypothetical protein